MDDWLPKAEIMHRWDRASKDVALALEDRLVLAFTGSASCGKDSAIRALFGVDFGDISPIPGSTSEVQLARLDDAGSVLVVNAPGFGDVRQEVDARAREVLEHLDLALYIVNSDGGATADEKRDLDALRALGRPVLVVLNKIDLIRAHQRRAFVEATTRQLGVDPADVVIAAFDPIRAVEAEPIGVDEVAAWVFRTLESRGKALLFARRLRNQASACDQVIRTAAHHAMAAGAIPVPGADMTAVSAVQVKLITDIAAIHEREIGREMVLFILGEVLAGSSKGFIRWAVRAFKTAGWIPGAQLAHLATSALGASVAGATTYGVGKATVAWMQSGPEMTGEQLRQVFDAAAFAYQQHHAGTEDPDADAIEVEVVEE